MNKILIIFGLIISSIASANNRWYGFNYDLAPLGASNYELTLYRYGKPATEANYADARLFAQTHCSTTYKELSKIIENSPDHTSLTYDYHCN